MKKLILLSIAGLLLLVQDVLAAPAEAIFSSSYSDRIQVTINGDLINAKPAQNVYVKSRPGLHQVRIRVFNQWGRLKFTHHDQIHVRPHSQNRFLLETHPFGGSKLVQLQKAPVKKPPHQAQKSKPIRHHIPRTALMNDQEFHQLQEALIYQHSDQDRLKLAKRSVKKRKLYTEDVKELMELFSYESSRLSFAKYAYRKVVDPARYELVFQALRYNSSIYQLEDFLARH